MIKRIMYASIFFVAVLFVMQSKGMLEQLRQWWHQGVGSGDEAAFEIFKEDPYERREDIQDDWEVVAEGPGKEIREAQEYVKKIEQEINNVDNAIKEIVKQALNEESKKELAGLNDKNREMLAGFRSFQEETSNLLARTSPDYEADAKKSIESNFEGTGITADEAYGYLYGEKKVEAADYPYDNIYQHIEARLESPNTTDEDKKILRQLGYVFRTALLHK